MHRHDTIDRISPTLEPDQPPLLHQNWHHLLFLHWEVPAAELPALCLRRLELRGRLRRPRAVHAERGAAVAGSAAAVDLGIPRDQRAHLRAPRRSRSRRLVLQPRCVEWDRGGGRAGGLPPAVLRCGHRLPCSSRRHAVDRFRFPPHRSRGAIGRLPRALSTGGRTGRSRAPGNPGALPRTSATSSTREDDRRDLHRARVHHQPYPVQRVDVSGLHETLIWAAGIKRSEQPAYAHYASEVNVKVYPLERV